MSEIFKQIGAERGVVVSTRVRLARNIAGHPFPGKLGDEEAKKIIADVRNAVESSAVGTHFRWHDLANESELAARSLMERHLISPEMLQTGRTRGALISDDGAVSIMINEEDHLRIQVIYPGLCIREAYEAADKIDDLINERLAYSFDKDLGYLTHCPTNLGCAMRASVMMHLPRLTESGAMEGLITSAQKIGYTVRGMYGEGSEASFGVYQISNQESLGVSEDEIVKGLSSVVGQIIEKERKISENEEKRDPDAKRDKVFRAIGTLGHAVIISTNEALALLFEMRGGIPKIVNVDYDEIDELIWRVMPASISDGKAIQPRERDLARAKLLREKLGKF